MPTTNFSLKDLSNLVGKKLTIEELDSLISYAKGEFNGYDKKTDEVTVSFDDTNLPYVWSVEGISLLLKGILGKEKGIPTIKVYKSNYNITVDPSLKTIRPYICSFVATSNEISEHLLKQLIQLQEKITESFGKKRSKVAIGVYSLKKIKFPINYTAVLPGTISFTPLDYNVKLNLSEILEKHPKGKEYSYLLENYKKYPIITDSNREVLSFPPIINSNYSGKTQVKDKDIFFEATGTDLNSVNLATNIFAQALNERGFKIYSCNILYQNKKVITPLNSIKKIKLDKKLMNKIIGLNINETKIKVLLERMRYNYQKGLVYIPFYRNDIIHNVDVIEDIAIAYNMNKIEPLGLESYTIGSTSKFKQFTDKIRELSIGLEFQEIFSSILSNKTQLYDRMNIQDFGTIEIENYMSEKYSIVRSWLIPILLEVLSENKHQEFPQKIFEQGTIVMKKDNKIYECERIAFVLSHSRSNYTEIKQVLDSIFNNIGLKYNIEEVEHNSFISGRVGRIFLNNKSVGFIGEIHPACLENWGLENPVSALELNLTEIFNNK